MSAEAYNVEITNNLMENKEAPLCSNCKTKLTIKHILTVCPLYYTERNTHQIQQDLKNNLSSPAGIQKTLKFIKEINV